MSWTQTSALTAGWSWIASSSDGTKLCAVIIGGGIYTSTDSGVTWTNANNAPTANWNGVSSNSDGTKLCACVNNGGIYTSTNSGATWTQQTNAPTAYWYSITSSSDGTKLCAVIYSGVIYTSTDSGVNWTNVNTAPTANWYGVSSNSDGTKLFATSRGIGSGYIYKSTDSGVNWTQTSAPNSSWGGIASSSDGTKLCAVVAGGGIYTSTDSGATWTNSNNSPTAYWRSIASNSDGTKLVACYPTNSKGGTIGYIYISIDSGSTWSVTNAPDKEWQSVASSANGYKLFAVALGDGIYASETSPAPTQIACFKEGTQILTIDGYVPIEDLRQGDLVKTLKHNYVPINMIGKSTIYNSSGPERIKNRLYRCSKREYKELFEDLILTGCHSILVDEFVSKLQRDKAIEVNGKIYITDNKYRLPAVADEMAEPYEKEGEFVIYHFALENDDYYMNYGIYANGLLVESCSQKNLKQISGMTII